MAALTIRRAITRRQKADVRVAEGIEPPSEPWVAARRTTR
jgi:hypothetical protein